MKNATLTKGALPGKALTYDECADLLNNESMQVGNLSGITSGALLLPKSKIETNQKENGKMNKIEIGTILTDKNGGKRKVLGIDDYGDATVSVLNNYGVEGHKMNLSIIQSAGWE